MKLVGLSGYARSGKDEFARVLVEDFGYTRIAFADKLREALYALNPVVNPTPEKYFTKPKEPVRLRTVIDEYGWDGYKETNHGDEIRALLQRMGTEVGREVLGENIWVQAAFKDLSEYERYVVTDMRFPNEYDAVLQRNGKVIRVERRDIGPARDANGNVHKSETSLDKFKFDETYYNYGTLDEFRQKIRRAFE